MKARKPNSDQSAEFTAFVDGDECTEYVLPHMPDPEFPEIVECFIPVKPGNRITIKGKFSGSIMYGRFDILADGAFLHESIAEPKKDHVSKEFEVKYVKDRKVAFDFVLNLPIPRDWNSCEWPKDMYEGYLHAKRLPYDVVGELHRYETPIRGSRRPGLGSVAIVVNASQSAVEEYNDAYWDMTVGNWKHRETKIVRKSGIQPDLEMEFQYKEEEPVSMKRSRKHRTHFEHTKPGAQPWGRFIFYYRLQEHLDLAGCAIRPDTIQDLEPADPTTFITAAETTVGGRIKYPKAGDTVTSNAANKPEPAMPTQAQTSDAGKPQPKPKKRLGGTLADYGQERKDESTSDVVNTKEGSNEVQIKQEPRLSAPPSMQSATQKPTPPPKPKKFKKLGGTLNLPKDFVSKISTSIPDQAPAGPQAPEPQASNYGEDVDMEDMRFAEEEPALPQSSHEHAQEPRAAPESARGHTRRDSALKPLREASEPLTPHKPAVEEDDDIPRFEIDVEGSAKLRERLEREKAQPATSTNNNSPTTPQLMPTPTPAMAADLPIPSSRKRESSTTPLVNETPSKRPKSDFDVKKAELMARIEESNRKLAEEQAARKAIQEAREEKKRAKQEKRERKEQQRRERQAREERELEEMHTAVLRAEEARIQEQIAREREEAEMEAEEVSSEDESEESEEP